MSLAGTYRSLVTHLEHAKRGAASLDQMVHTALGAEVMSGHGRMGYAIRKAPYYPWAMGPTWCSMPRVTASVEEARKLFRLQLGDHWALTIIDCVGHMTAAAIPVDDHGDFGKPELDVERWDDQLALGIVAAMLLALAWEAENPPSER